MESYKQNYHETFGAYLWMEIIINQLDCKGISFALFKKKKNTSLQGFNRIFKVEKMNNHAALNLF